DERCSAVHVLQPRAPDLACGFDLRARRREIAFALLHIGDVASRADQADCMSIRAALRDAALARPPPGVVVREVAILDKEARGGPLEVIDDCLAILIEVVAMDA